VHRLGFNERQAYEATERAPDEASSARSMRSRIKVQVSATGGCAGAVAVLLTCDGVAAADETGAAAAAVKPRSGRPRSSPSSIRGLLPSTPATGLRDKVRSILLELEPARICR